MPDVEEHACNTTKGTNLPWVEKYRPNGLQELISHEDIISTIRYGRSKCGLPFTPDQNTIPQTNMHFDLLGPSSSRIGFLTCSSMARLELVLLLFFYIHFLSLPILNVILPGKTSTILACAKEIYSPQQFNSMVGIALCGNAMIHLISPGSGVECK